MRLEVLDQWSWQRTHTVTERVMPVPDGESAHPHPRAGALGCLQSRRSGGSYALRCTSLPENWLRMVTYGAWGSLPAVT